MAQRNAETGLGGCRQPLAAAYDLGMFDLDGVIYIGTRSVPGAAEHLAAARKAGMSVAFVTNNAARPPAVVADHLSSLGIPAAATDVVTSAQAAAHLLSDRCAPGDRVFVIGGEGLIDALEERGLVPTSDLEQTCTAVVSGYSPELRWRTVIDGAILIARGLPWVASNTDRTVPTRHGPGPGTGVLVRAISDFTGIEPVVAGKPEPPLLLETHERVGGSRPLMVGDRLDTDIAGARRTGFDSLLVMTGVTGMHELVAADPQERPTYVAADLGALGRAQTRPQVADGWCGAGGWRARVDDGAVRVDGTGQLDQWWQAVATCGWAHLDVTGEVADVSRLVPPVLGDGPNGG